MAGYSNVGFSANFDRDDRDAFNNRLEIAKYQAYNETFVDDEGKVYMDLAKYPRSPRKETVGFHRYDTSPKKVYESIEALHKRYEDIDSANEEYVDYPEDRLGIKRESPLGCSGPRQYERTTPTSTPKKKSPFNTPTKVSLMDTVVLAPMFASIEKRHLHRSRSTIVSSPRKPVLIRSPKRSSAIVKPHSFARNSLHFMPQQNLGRSTQNLVPKYHTPVRLQSFNHLLESELMDANYETLRSPNRKPNTAIITPNMRSSIAPLLPSPSRHEHIPPPAKSPSNFSKVSWATLPTIHLPTELLCVFGFIMLLAGAASTILCFYLLSIGGRRYYLNFGALAGSFSFILGMFSCRTNKWRWLPHRNYLTGYVLLGTFSLLNAACLGGIIYAFESQSSPLIDTLGGAVCGVSTLLIIGSIIGMVTSGCCHRPPPDNRVAHCVSGFTV